MTPSEFIIKKFEKHNPELVKLIDEWIENSIDRNWPRVQILLGAGTVPECPRFESYNKRWKFFEDLSKEVATYLVAKGYVSVGTIYPSTLQGKNGQYFNGHEVFGYLIEQPN